MAQTLFKNHSLSLEVVTLKAHKELYLARFLMGTASNREHPVMARLKSFALSDFLILGRVPFLDAM